MDKKIESINTFTIKKTKHMIGIMTTDVAQHRDNSPNTPIAIPDVIETTKSVTDVAQHRNDSPDAPIAIPDVIEKTKSITDEKKLKISIGHNCQQGHRYTMEDEIIVNESKTIPDTSFGCISLFGVYDGHGGKNCSIFTRDHLYPYLIKHLSTGGSVGDAFTSTYRQLDEEYTAVKILVVPLL